MRQALAPPSNCGTARCAGASQPARRAVVDSPLEEAAQVVAVGVQRAPAVARQKGDGCQLGFIDDGVGLLQLERRRSRLDGGHGSASSSMGRVSEPARRSAGVQGYVAPMPVFALWSAPRARSTAFFRSMLERGDLLALHEPLEGLTYFGATDVEGRAFESSESLLAWLRDETRNVNVFLKETTDSQVLEVVLGDGRFLAEARHAFLIRRPDEIAASLFAVIQTIKGRDALYPDMRIESIGLEALHDLYAAVRDAGGHHPVVIESDDLMARPEATMAAYCAAVGLPFISSALTWEPGERPEWRRSARWHVDVSASSGFEPPKRRYPHTVETSEELARFAAHHVPFYEKLHAQRLNVEPSDPMGGC